MSPHRKLAAKFERLVQCIADIDVVDDDFAIIKDCELRQRIIDSVYKIQTAGEQLARDVNIMVYKGETHG